MTGAADQQRAADLLGSLGAVYDHVAHAVPSIRAVLPLYCGLLGGVVCSGGINPWGGHVAVHIQFPNETRLELLEPVRRDAPSVSGFLAASPRGGLHHVTFKVPDIEVALDRVVAAGYHPVGTNIAHTVWRETFLHPRETAGVLIQLAQAESGIPGPLERPLDELLDEAARLREADIVAQ